MKRGLALVVLGLWAILQTTKGPLAEKLGLIAAPSAPGPTLAPGGKPVPPGTAVPGSPGTAPFLPPPGMPLPK